MLNDKYTVEAGRSIKRNGAPFVHISRSCVNVGHLGTDYKFPATDADTFAHYAAAAPALIEAACRLRDALVALGFRNPDAAISGADTVDVVAGHWAAFYDACKVIDDAEDR